jgi:hypothetical protein
MILFKPHRRPVVTAMPPGNVGAGRPCWRRLLLVLKALVGQAGGTRLTRRG